MQSTAEESFDSRRLRESRPASPTVIGSRVARRARAQQALWLGSLLAYAIFLTCLHWGATSAWHLAAPEKMVRFEAAAPFQQRVLVPLVVAGLQRVVPIDELLLFALVEVAAWMALVVLAHRALVAFGIGGPDVLRRVLAFTVVVPMLVHLIVPDLRVDLPRLENGGLLAGVWDAPSQFYYVYDLPAALFVFALVLAAAHAWRQPGPRSLAPYLALFALATVNRETTVFLIPFFFLLFFRRLDRGTFVGALVFQVAVFFAIQSVLQWSFEWNRNPHASVPGTAYELHWKTNLGLLLHPLYLPSYLARFGAGLYVLVFLFRRHLDPVLRTALLGFGLPFLASVILFGRLQEHRVQIEIVPLIWLAAIQVTVAATSRAAKIAPVGARAAARLS